MVTRTRTCPFAGMLHSNACHHARLSGSAFTAQEVGEVVRDDGVFVSKARPAGQFSR
jgi:hypothetical protein